MKNRALAGCFFFFLALTVLPAIEGTRQHIKVMEAVSASAPELIEDMVYFSYNPAAPVRYVAVVFAHENFQQPHVFKRNDHGILFFFYPAPTGLRSLDYRFIVDGLWTTDPANPLKVRDDSGLSLSRYELPQKLAETPLRSPARRTDGMTEFNVTAPSGKIIYLSGSFNGWDPYMYRLDEVKPGLYSFSLRLLPGTYYYIFHTEGKKRTDPLNPNKGYDTEGYEFSVVNVPPR
ncbi:MAG: hypothetical protein LBC67_06510 [Spirochaetales bacterium]|jgi:hypothetical protein|nr:hypothetical protein [Spirochaetales bacterium]